VHAEARETCSRNTRCRFVEPGLETIIGLPRLSRVLAYQANLPLGQQRLLSWSLPNGVVSAVRILRGGLRGNPEIPAESSIMFSNGDLLLLIVNVDQAQLVTLHVELEPDPAPFYLGPTDIVSALLPNTDSTASYLAYETIYVPWPVEVLSVNSTTCR